jgi:hypothetical protein
MYILNKTLQRALCSGVFTRRCSVTALDAVGSPASVFNVLACRRSYHNNYSWPQPLVIFCLLAGSVHRWLVLTACRPPQNLDRLKARIICSLGADRTETSLPKIPALLRCLCRRGNQLSHGVYKAVP